MREYRKIVVIATEGQKTEPAYFRLPIFRPPSTCVHVRTISSKTKSSPRNVLKRMKKYIADYGIKGDDEAWLVVDRDCWKEEDLDELHEWASAGKNRGLAVSNPHFEYWLVLHFEEGHDIHDSGDCLLRLGKHLPQYEKGELEAAWFTLEDVKVALARAKKKDRPACKKWPTTPGTTVYRVIERILFSQGC